MAVAKVILNGTTLIDTTQKTVQADKMVASYTALDKAGESITGSIATKTSSDLTASGATVTAPSGYYASAASKAVSSGSATTPATTITANPTISVNSSTGVISASVSNTQSVTPTVSAGYVSSGTAGTITVSGSNTSNLSTQAAATITPSTSSQTAVAAGKYTLGAVTVAGDANLVAENIKKDVSIFGVTGSYEGGGSVSGIKYIDTNTEGNGAWDVGGYQYCSVDGAPLNDNHTRCWLDLTSLEGTLDVSVVLRFNRTQGTATVDWGDGSNISTVTSSSFTSTTDHTYSTAGVFVIDIEFVSGTIGVYGFSTSIRSNIIYSNISTTDTTNVIGWGGQSTFSPTIRRIYYASSVTKVSSNSYCPNLEYVELSPNTTSLSTSMFDSCTSLKEITIPNSVTSIPAGLMRSCTSLKSLTIPSSITSIGEEAFYGASNILEYHVLPTTPPTLASISAFTGHHANFVIYVPSSSLSAYQTATNWSNYASYMVGE